jgi:beta-galactosidase
MRPLRFLILCLTLAAFSSWGASAYKPPTSPRATYDFNPDWKFIREDAPGAERMEFDDAKWTTVSTPHTWNDTDTYDETVTHSGGERHQYMGIGWYRKHFKLPADAKDKKIILELEGLKQAGRFWVNGKFVGLHENGVTACGLDLTSFVKFGDADNVIAVKVDNSNNYREEATGIEFQWVGRAFNPNYGGLNHNVRLHIMGKIHQTLPVYENLKTTGIYIYSSQFDLAAKSCEVNVESQVQNESEVPQLIELSVAIVDASGALRTTLKGDSAELGAGQTKILKATGILTGARFWDVDDPHLYDAYSILKVAGKTVDASRIRTGFRKTEFRGGAGTGGVWLNGRFVYLTGYAQRSTDDWAGLGQAYPDWMHDLNASLVRDTHANYTRWMHISPQRVDVLAGDSHGIVQVCPAGDKEADVQGRQWEQRMEVMRDSIIYYRNNPSILFWEAGNNGISPEHMRQMTELRREWDPNGGRVMGCRTLNDPGTTEIAEYYGVMIGQDPRTDQLRGPTNMFRAYSAERRDRAPFIETEDFRDEAPRRIWDDYSPPHFGFKPKTNDTYHWTSETFCLMAAVRYHEYVLNCISNTDPSHSKWAGYASIYWSDSNADGRQEGSEVCRVSGKIDSVRLPKQAYYVYQVMQNSLSDIHIIGHWNYPSNTVKTIYVAANHCDAVELLVNEKSVGASAKPCDFVDSFNNRNQGGTGYIYAFPEVKFEPGKIKAVARAREKIVANDEIQTAGPPARMKLTAHTGPGGLQADGSDVVLVDFEVVDAQGRRCPTDEARVDFKLDGPGIWRGGYNSGLAHSVNNTYLNTECGINRVSIRSTLKPGTITLTATRAGLKAGTVKIESKAVKIRDGLGLLLP